METRFPVGGTRKFRDYPSGRRPILSNQLARNNADRRLGLSPVSRKIRTDAGRGEVFSHQPCIGPGRAGGRTRLTKCPRRRCPSLSPRPGAVAMALEASKRLQFDDPRTCGCRPCDRVGREADRAAPLAPGSLTARGRTSGRNCSTRLPPDCASASASPPSRRPSGPPRAGPGFGRAVDPVGD